MLLSATQQNESAVCIHILRRRQWHPTPVLLPGKSQGWRRLLGCRPWGREESDRTERLHFHFSLSCIGEGNGTPLQCSFLENPRDGGAWWATVCGVAQSRIRLNDSAAAAGGDGSCGHEVSSITLVFTQVIIPLPMTPPPSSSGSLHA